MNITDKEVEEYIKELPFSGSTPDLAITLVKGNIRGFWEWVKLQEKPSIFKKNTEIIVEKVDMSDPDIKAEIENINKQQAGILDRKKIDSSTLRKVINI